MAATEAEFSRQKGDSDQAFCLAQLTINFAAHLMSNDAAIVNSVGHVRNEK